uniref:Transmembrane protein n=1 Tax=Rhizophora mucronata TaxID=61149 RepID=A0A2P2NFS9_RHIMU
MNDWAAPLIAAALFAILSPGLVFQMPGKERPIDFMNMKTSLPSMLVHLVIYGLLLILFLIILHVHLYV